MTKSQNDLKIIIDELKTQRDMLSLKIHLAKSEVKEEWQVLERKWDNLAARSEQLSTEVRETSQDIYQDLKDIGEDLQEGYTRIKNILH